MSNGNPVGKTKTQGWEIGVSKTLPVSVPEAWGALTSDAGKKAWFGEGGALPLEKGATFETNDGTVGRMVSIDAGGPEKGKMVRMRWRPRRWDFDSTLQVRVMPAKRGATIRFHQEKLESGAQREEMRVHWQEVMQKIEKIEKMLVKD